jgi:hypothetical protein
MNGTPLLGNSLYNVCQLALEGSLMPMFIATYLYFISEYSRENLTATLEFSASKHREAMFIEQYLSCQSSWLFHRK